MMTIKKISIAFVLLAMTLVSCTTNSLAGRSSFNMISEQEELAMGEDAYRQVLAEEKLSTNKKDIARLQSVSARLIEVASPDMPNAAWEFNVLESNVINAFAVPGGKVAIYSALLHLLNDDEVAYVLGHEIAHVTLHHGSERMSQQMLVNVGSALVSVFLGNKDEKTSSIFLAAYGLGSQVGILLPFSRKNELEADKFGTMYAAKAGYNPEASITTLQKFKEMSKGQQQEPEFLSTHPLDDSRIRALQQNMDEFKKLGK